MIEFVDLANIQLIYFAIPKEIRYKRVLERDVTNNYNLNLETLEKFETIFEEPKNEDEIINKNTLTM